MEYTECLHVWKIDAGANFSLIPVIVGMDVSPDEVIKGLGFLIKATQTPIFLREPLKRFASPDDLNQPLTSSSLCVIFSDAVVPPNMPEISQLKSLPDGCLADTAFAIYSLNIAPSIANLKRYASLHKS